MPAVGLGWRAECQQPGALHGISKTKCQPLECQWGPIYLCCSTGANVGMAGERVNKVGAGR